MSDEKDTRSEAERRRLHALVFGEVLPDATSDDQPDPREGRQAEDNDAWLRSQVPPHHGK